MVSAKLDQISTIAFFEMVVFHHAINEVMSLSETTLVGLDQTLLFQLIEEHRLDFIFFPLLKSHGSHLQLFNKIKQQLIMSKCLLELTAILNEKQISYRILKGLPLNQQLYGNKQFRISRDIDLLINAKELNNVHAILLLLGYRSLQDLSLYQLQKRSDLMQVMKEISYRHESYSVIIELHWNVTQAAEMNFIDLTHSALQLQLKDQWISVLNNEDNFLYLCLHAAFHNWERLGWLIDIARFYQKFSIDWIKLVKKAKKYYLCRPLLEAKLLLKTNFELEMPFYAYTSFDYFICYLRLMHVKKIWQNKILKRHLSPCCEVFFYSLLLPSFRQKYQYIKGLLLQGKDSLQLWHHDFSSTQRTMILKNIVFKLKALVKWLVVRLT